MVDSIRSIKVERTDLVSILNKMVAMQQEEGYMDFIEKGGIYTLTYFTENPKFNGNDAIKITQKEMLDYLLQ